ncbi:MAG: methionine--tRNA ligase [Victivallaceae bacterium]|nr:methionine--tRNA ligase [Victivallaceae bacterium]
MSIYITTAIPYVNSSPHIGFALELVQADALCRYYRWRGEDVFLLTGSDDNAFKNVISAREHGIDVAEFVDRNSGAFQNLSRELGVSYNNFIRTSGTQHHQSVHQFWRNLNSNDLYRKNYNGLYCFGCEDFLSPKDLVDGLCPEHLAPPTPVAEKNYFFRLSKYQLQLEKLIENNVIEIYPEHCRNEVLTFIRNGLHDISISRSAERIDNWGIPVPGDPDQVIYVWIDALINYLSGLGYNDSDCWRKYWREDSLKIHVIGKNVWKFHAVYWPALLLSAGLPLPNKIFIHGFFTVNGRKIGKSLGNGVDPTPIIRDFGADAVRYYLLSAGQPFNDCDFSLEKLTSAYNTNLANGIGNLFSRLIKLSRQSKVPVRQLTTSSAFLEKQAANVESFRFNTALNFIRDEITSINREIDQQKPWEAIKRCDILTLERILPDWLNRLHGIADLLTPFTPECVEKIKIALQRPDNCPVEQLFPRIKSSNG